MVKIKGLHCARIPIMMIYSDNMITWKRASNVCSNPKEWSQASMVSNYRFFEI